LKIRSHLLYTRHQAPADAGENIGGREAPPQLGSIVDDDAGEGKPRTCKRTTPTTPPRQRRPEATYLHAGTPIWGFPILPPPERPAEDEKSRRYAGGRRESPSRLRFAS
jgi:hypothetical protein